MPKLIQLRKNHPVLYSAAAGVLSVLLILLAGLAVGLAAGLLCPGADYYVLTLLQEVLGFALVYGVAWASGFGGVLRQKGCGLLRGLGVGLYPLALILLAAVSNGMLCLEAGTPLAPWYRILAFCGTMLFIGLAEELPFRGLVAGTLLEAFGTSRAGVWKATVLSGLIFGAAHFTNLIGAAPLGVLVQVTVTSVLGMLFAAIYFRTGNLWVTVILHALMDLASLLPTGLFASGAEDAVSAVISEYGLINLIPVITYGIPLVFLLRGKKLPEIQRLWTRPVAPAPAVADAAAQGERPE